jgi:hypothetical protein
MRMINAEISRMIPGRPGPRLWLKFHFCATNRRCHRNSVSGHTIVSSFIKALRPDGLRLPPQKCSLCIGEPNALPTQSLLQELVLGLQKFDDDQLMAMHPARHDHEQKRQ